MKRLHSTLACLLAFMLLLHGTPIAADGNETLSIDMALSLALRGNHDLRRQELDIDKIFHLLISNILFQLDLFLQRPLRRT